MVVAVLADIVKVIVFATCADALSQSAEPPNQEVQRPIYLLRVYRALQLGQRFGLANRPEKDRLELVHARVREQESGVIVRDDRGRRHCGAVRSVKSMIP